MTDLNNTLMMDMATLNNQRPFSYEPPPFSLVMGDHGRLHEQEGRLHYEGDYHESATVFMDYLCSTFNLEVSRLRRENAELREANGQLADAAICPDGLVLFPVGFVEMGARYAELNLNRHGNNSDVPALMRAFLPK